MSIDEQELSDAQKRLVEREDRAHAEVLSAWEHIPDELRRVFKYIHRAIPHRATMDREADEIKADIKLLNDTREQHFKPFRKHIEKEDASSGQA